ncbi:MAG: hypothetical protein EOP00_18605 [Pedobacter sp.]|nr:MAG: hypothetical protein EOP00_18605 [Pedobacter sp.]
MRNKTIPIIGILALALCLFNACRNEKKQRNKDTITVSKVDTLAKTTETSSPGEEANEPGFPARAKTIKAFIPKYYDIDMEAEGDLNRDGLKDQAMILINAKDTTAQRVALVLFLQSDNSYVLNAKSFSVVEPKYSEDGYQNYDFEEISIDKNGQLTISQQATGPNGSLESIYKYINNELVLTNITSFNMGAGGQTELKLDLLKGIFEETDINTMKEDMPSKTFTKQYKIPKVTFENSSPRDVIIKAFDVNGVQ